MIIRDISFSYFSLKPYVVSLKPYVEAFQMRVTTYVFMQN